MLKDLNPIRIPRYLQMIKICIVFEQMSSVMAQF